MTQLLIYIPLTTMIAYIIILGIVIGSTKNALAKRYIFYLISVIVWSFGAFMMRTSIGPGSLFYNRILVMGFVFVPVTFYHFINTYAGVKGQKLLLKVAYGYTLLLVMANFFGLIIEDAWLIDGSFHYSLGPLAPATAILSFILLSVSFFNVLDAVKKRTLPLKRVIYIFTGIKLVFLGSLFNLFPVIGQYPVDILTNLINAFLITHSIYKYKFLELKVVVKKGVTYSLSTFIISFTFMLFVLLIKNQITSRFGPSDLLLIIFMAFIFTLIYDPLRKLTYNLLGRFIQKDIINQSKISYTYSKHVQSYIELDPLKDYFLKTLKKGVNAEHVYFAEHQSFHNYSLVANHQVETFFLHDTHPIVTWFKNHNYLTEIDWLYHEHFEQLINTEKQMLKRLKTEMILPLFYHKKLKGLLLFTEKSNHETYQKSEILFIENIIMQTAPILDNARLYAKAKYEAITDSLTGLYNHRYFYDYMNTLTEKETLKPFSIALIDIDLFKFYNDLYGHAAGDEILKKVSKIIKEYVGDDIAVRYGGEEFVLIIKDKVLKEAYEWIDRLRERIAKTSSHSDNQVTYTTVSIGIASYPHHIDNPYDLMKAADDAMYEAKHSGRNTTVLYQGKHSLEKDANTHVRTEVKEAYASSIYALAATIDAKDNYTYGHSENVSKLAVRLAEYMGLSQNKQLILKNAGLLHDIGKIGIPEYILKKQGSLSREEFDMMQKHVDLAVGIIKHVPTLTEIIPAVMSHHERYDGKGYPRGLKGDMIPLEAKILTIVDAFDAMITGRPYKGPKTIDTVIEEIKKEKGKQFDPEITESFISFIDSDQFDTNTLVNRL